MLTYTSTADRYTVSGSSYTINFPYWKETEVKAVITLTDGTLQDLVLNTDYSVSTPNGNNGTLTKLTAWTDADKLTIYRDSAKTQEVDLVQGQKINADTIENSLDHSVAIMQELQEKLSRTIASSIDEAGTDIEFPGKTARAGNLLGFDATGENIAFRNLAQFDADVANTATNASAASASATLAQKWAENPEDTPVVTGSYSALHHAAKAKASATSASTDATTATNKALDSEAYAIGKRNGSDVPATDPAYHNNTKYYYDLVVGAISGALRYQGTWTTTGATDYSGISTPRAKGDLFYCQGTACTIDGVTYTQGDLIIFNSDVADGGTITTAVIDKIDNTETVTPDNTCTLSNKTIAFGSNTMTDVASTNTTQTLTNKTISCADNDITTTASKVIVSDSNGKVGASSVPSNMIGVGEVHTATKAAGWGTSTKASYIVVNGICQLWGTMNTTSSGSNVLVFTGIPKPASSHYGTLTTDSAGGNFQGWLYHIEQDGSSGKMSVWSVANTTPYFSLMYIVADDWIES